MGNLILYNDQNIGDVAKAKWRLMRQLLPIAIAFVNASMKEAWEPGTLRNVVVSTSGVTPAVPATSTAPSARAPFSLEAIFDDQSDTFDEIHLLDAAELQRLFTWCDFLVTRDGAYELIQPVIEALRIRTRGAFELRP